MLSGRRVLWRISQTLACDASWQPYVRAGRIVAAMRRDERFHKTVRGYDESFNKKDIANEDEVNIFPRAIAFSVEKCCLV